MKVSVLNTSNWSGPADPADGYTLWNATDDDVIEINFEDSKTFTLGERIFSNIFLQSNGWIQFDSSSRNFSANISDFVQTYGISIPWQDYYLYSGNSIGYKQTSDQFIVIYNTSEIGSGNNVQIKVTFNLDNNSNPGNITLDFGQLDNNGNQNGLFGISYGADNNPVPTQSNIDLVSLVDSNTRINYPSPIVEEFPNNGNNISFFSNKSISFSKDIEPFSQIVDLNENGMYIVNGNEITNPSSAPDWAFVGGFANPYIDFTDGVTLKFYAKRLNGVSVNIKFDIEYRRYPNIDPIIVTPWIEINSDEYQLYRIEVSPTPLDYEGFILRVQERDTPFEFQLNNLEVVNVEVVQPPTNLINSNVTSSSVELSWTPGGSETEWRIQYGPSGFTLGSGTTIDVTSNPYTLNGLTQLTNYDAYVAAVEGSNISSYDGPTTFTTLAPSVSTATIVFNMEGKLYDDLETLNQSNPAEVSSIVQNALLSVFNISNVTIQSLQFNSIDVEYTATGDFDATNFEIYESDSTNVVNSFVTASNDASLSTGPYTSSDLTLTAVDSRGEITDPDGDVIAFTCFAAGSIVETDQGNIAIERINKNKHTINGKKIVSLTKNVLGGNEIVNIKKNGLGENKPSQETLVSPNHLISYQGEMKEAKWIAENVEGASLVPYKNQILYNIVMEQYDEMKVNNMVTETLHPDNIVAKIYKNDNFLERRKLIKEFNESVKQNGYNTAKKIFKKRI